MSYLILAIVCAISALAIRWMTSGKKSTRRSRKTAAKNQSSGGFVTKHPHLYTEDGRKRANTAFFVQVILVPPLLLMGVEATYAWFMVPPEEITGTWFFYQVLYLPALFMGAGMMVLGMAFSHFKTTSGLLVSIGTGLYLFWGLGSLIFGISDPYRLIGRGCWVYDVVKWIDHPGEWYDLVLRLLTLV